MKNLKKLGKVLGKQKQKSVFGGRPPQIPFGTIPCSSTSPCPTGYDCLTKWYDHFGEIGFCIEV